MDVSSRNIRSWIHDGKSVRYYVPDEVRHYIEEQLMYRGTME